MRGDSPDWPRTRYATNARYDRFEVCRGLDGWIYSYREGGGARAGALATGVEIGVHLAGQWWQRGRRSTLRQYGPGMVHTLSPGERYDLAYEAGVHPGTVVGFNLYPALFFGSDEPDAELQIDPCCTRDARLLQMCWTLYRARADGLPPPAEVAGTVGEFVARHADRSPPDPLWRAKKEIDRFFAHDLYLEHLAEVAAMHRRTFLRQFGRRFGVSPVQYRIKQRLNHIARQSWVEPERSIAELAAEAGFAQREYAHRAFRRYFGTTPAAYRRR